MVWPLIDNKLLFTPMMSKVLTLTYPWAPKSSRDNTELCRCPSFPSTWWANIYHQHPMVNIWHCIRGVCVKHRGRPGIAKVMISDIVKYWIYSCVRRGWVGLWGFLWWAPSAKRKDHHGVSSGWSSVWHRSNTGLSSTQYEQIPIILGVWPFWLTPFFFRSIIFWWAYGQIVFPLLKLLSFFWLTCYCSIGLCFSVRV